jgi:hypothetical protein
VIVDSARARPYMNRIGRLPFGPSRCLTVPVSKKDSLKASRRPADPNLERVPKAIYDAELYRLQAELVKMQ